MLCSIRHGGKVSLFIAPFGIGVAVGGGVFFSLFVCWTSKSSAAGVRLNPYPQLFISLGLFGR